MLLYNIILSGMCSENLEYQEETNCTIKAKVSTKVIWCLTHFYFLRQLDNTEKAARGILKILFNARLQYPLAGGPTQCKHIPIL